MVRTSSSLDAAETGETVAYGTLLTCTQCVLRSYPVLGEVLFARLSSDFFGNTRDSEVTNGSADPDYDNYLASLGYKPPRPAPSKAGSFIIL